MSEHSSAESPAAPGGEDVQKSSVSPPAGRPRREGNESLWKRARRTLGTNSLTFLQPQSRPTGAASTTPGSGPAPPNKRREQVRHAQRTHRQRTQNYIKTLESEVVRLRESETKLLEERGRLQAQIESLRATVVSSNLPLPPGLDHPNPSATQSQAFLDFDMPATVSYSTDDLAHQRLQVSWPTKTSPTAGSLGYQQDQIMQSFDASQDFNALPGLSHDFALQQPSVTTDSPSPIHLSSNTSPFSRPVELKAPSTPNNIETAIEFVLALEHPCMQHIPYPANPATEDPANHIMMMSTPLVARAPESPKPNTSWQANAAIIKELLNLSSSINLEGEITPVEAWHRLHQHPDFWRLDKAAVHRLKGELSLAVRCCGFGAVLDEDVFWHAVNNLFATIALRGPG